jgi:hypothetical protein
MILNIHVLAIFSITISKSAISSQTHNIQNGLSGLIHLDFSFSIKPKIPGKINTVVTKQAPTPIVRSLPNQAQAGKTENIIEPKASMVVREVNKIALPVLEKTVWMRL